MDETHFDALWSPDSPESIDDAIERAGMHAQARMLSNPEWTAPRHYHLNSIVEAVAAGIIAGDPWYRGYQLPPNYEAVVNRAAAMLQDSPPGQLHGDEVLEVSLLDMKTWLKEVLTKDSDFVAWNDAPGDCTTSRCSTTPEQRVFIDLDAAIQNIAINLRDQTRKSDAFDARFKKNHPEFDNEEEKP